MHINKKLTLLFLSCISILLITFFFINKKVLYKMTYKINNINDLFELFPKSPEQIKCCAKQCKQDIDAKIQKILDIPENERNFENTAKALDSLGLLFTPVLSSIQALENLSPDKSIRETAYQVSLELNNFIVDKVSLNVDLYKAFKAYVNGNAKKEKLDANQLYFIKETMDDYKRSGLDLPKEKLEQVKKLTKEIAALSLEFSTNIAESKNELHVKLEDLDGLSNNFIESLKKDEKGNYILGCDYPTFNNVMDNCNFEKTRKNLCIAYLNRAYPKNIGILDSIIFKRDELARLLGFTSYADLVISDEMAKSCGKVEVFLNDLISKATVKAQKEIEMFISDMPNSVTLVDGKIKPWDTKYLKNAYKKKHLNIDEQKIAEYFPMDNTIQQLLNIYEKFLSLKFKESTVKNVFWHEDVKLIEAYDNNNILLGYLLLDLYPRDNKFSHAAHMTIVPAIKDHENNNLPCVGIVMANFPKPTNSQPSLLKYNDVKTFFHEFGHAIHALLGRTELASFSGTNVKRDFVEMPSQMLEDWLKDREILEIVSSHYKTGSSLPNELITKIINLEKFDSGNFVLGQAYYAFLSLEYFKPGAKKDTQEIAQNVHKRILTNTLWIPEDHLQASFGHLTDYGPSYYGYLWSKVYAKDLFNEIKRYGLLDPMMGQKYIHDVIGKGGSEDPNELIRSFLGREPNQKAFLKDMGF